MGSQSNGAGGGGEGGGRLWEGAEEESGAEKAFQLYISHSVRGTSGALRSSVD